MARLQWDQVANPNFSGTLDGLVASSRLISGAFAQAKDGIDELRQTQTNNADNAITSELLKYQGNPEALMADLGSGAFQGRVDLSKASQKTRDMLMSAPGELLKFAENKLAFDNKQKVADDIDFVRQNRDVFNPYYVALRMGDDAAARKIMAANPDKFTRVNTDTLINLDRQGFDIFGDSTRTKQDAWKFGTDVEEQEATRKAQEWFERFTYEGTGEAGANAQRAELQKENPLAFQKLMSRFSGIDPMAQFFGGSAPSGSSGGGGTGVGAGGKNIHDVLLGDGQGAGGGNKYGFATAKPLTQMTMGELYDYQRNVMVPKTAALGVGNGQGSSAAGAYQIVSKTLAPAAEKLFGSNWRSMPFSVENQDRLGEYLFNQAKANGTDLHKVWEGLPAGTNPANLTWDQARSMITRAESGGIADPRRAQVAINTSLAQGGALDSNRASVIDFAKAWESTANITEVTNKLVGKGGAFEGENAGNVQKLVQQVMDLGMPNAEVAGLILSRNTAGNESGVESFFDGWANPFSDGVTKNYNWDAIKNQVELYKDPKALQNAALAESDRQTAAAQFAGANQRVADLEARKSAAQVEAALRGRPFNSRPWDLLIAQAKGQQVAAGRSAAVTAGASLPSTNGGDSPRPSSPPPAQSVAGEPLPLRQARNILKLRGKIQEKQAATFQQTYGMTPQEAIANPGNLPSVGSEVTVALNGASRPTRGQLIIDANAALAQGAAAIAAFQRSYGVHPRTFLAN